MEKDITTNVEFIETPDTVVRYCRKYEEGKYCNTKMLRSKEKRNGHYLGKCPVCGREYKNYNACAVVPFVKTVVPSGANVSTLLQVLKDRAIADKNSLNPVEIGKIVRDVRAIDPKMSYKKMSEQTGIKSHLFSNAVRSLDLPVEVQEYILEGSINPTDTVTLVQLLDNCPPDTILKLAGRIVNEKLTTDDSRAIKAKLVVVKEVGAMFTEVGVDQMVYDQIVNAPKEKPSDNVSVVESIFKKLLNKDTEASVALAPAQVYIPTTDVVHQQAVYFKRKQRSGNAQLSTLYAEPVSIKSLFKTEDGFAVYVKCEDAQIPVVSCDMLHIQMTPGEVYSGDLFDEQSQTISLFDGNLRLLDTLSAVTIARDIRLGRLVLNCATPMRIAGKNMQEVIHVGVTYYIAVDEVFDYTQTFYYDCVDRKGNVIKSKF